jgi:hypothetical protein
LAPARKLLSLKTGFFLVGIFVKSGQRTLLKRFFCSVSMHSVLL